MTDAEIAQARGDGVFLYGLISPHVRLRRSGKDWKGPCPFHREKTPSFVVYEDGHYHCFGCGAKGTAFDWFMQREGISFPEAVEIVARERGIAPTGPKPKSGNGNGNGSGPHAGGWIPILPVPSSAPKPTAKQLQCTTLHEYRGADGALLCYVRRVEKPDGSKDFYPLTFGELNSKLGWHTRAPLEPRPLYRLDVLGQWPPDARIVLVEGEKSADAAQRIFPDYVCLSWMGGANADEKADLSPLLEGKRNVILWPDADDPGRAAVARLARRLPHAYVVETDGLPDGFDAADLEQTPETFSRYHWLEARLKRPTEPPDPLGIRDAGDIDYASIPPREWLLGTVFCKQFLSSLIAGGATGKTALRIAQVAAFVTGRDITGEHVHRKGRALILSFEDDERELDRRVYAMLKGHGITPADVKGRLFTAAPKGLKLARNKGQAAELVDLLRSAIIRLKIDLVVLDPFIKTHSLDENDNAAMDFLCDLLASIAIDLNVAIDFPHHTSKGAATAGDANKGRGASSSKDAGRLVYTLTTMTAEEAEQFGISEDERRSLVRLDSAKVNIAPSSREAKWFRLVGVKLGNVRPDYPNGDEVQTVEPWMPPEAFHGLDSVLCNRILDAIDQGLDGGKRRYSDHHNAGDRAAWPVVQEHAPDKDEKRCKAVIKAWIKSGTLYRQDYTDPGDRHDAKGLFVDATKRPS